MVIGTFALLLYQIYVLGRGNNNMRGVAWTAYLAYLVSRYIVLLLNRTREYMAYHYSATVTHAPGDLSSALVKIACGLVRSQGEYQQKIFSRSDAKSARAAQCLEGTLAVQCCRFSPAGYVGAGSPDRADAAIWALTELMLDHEPQPNIRFFDIPNLPAY
jgi:hypothetical protein